MQVSLPGHIIILVPKDLQVSAQPGQHEFWPASPQEATVLDMPQDHLVIVLQQGLSRASPSDIKGLGNTSDRVHMKTLKKVL